MGTPNQWTGAAPATYHTFTVTFATTASGNGTATITHGSQSVEVDYLTGDTAIVTAAAVYAALNASTIPEIAEITWTYTVGDAFVTGTMIEPGVPAYVSAATTGATGTTVAVADVIAASGPNFINVAGNFDLGLPVDGQDVIFAGGPDCLYGFDTPGWTGAPRVFWYGSYTGAFGLPKYRASGNGQTYLEFRDRFMSLPGVLNVVGIGPGNGPSRVNAELANGSELRVLKTASSASDNEAAVNVFPKTGNTPAAINVSGGSVAIGWGDSAADTGTTVTLVSVNGEDAVVTIGRDLTVTETELNAGTVESHAVSVGVEIRGGTYTQSDGEISTLFMSSGVANLDHAQDAADTIALTVEAVAELDAPRLELARTAAYKKFSGGTVKGGAVVNDPFGSCEFAAVVFDNASLKASAVGDGFAVTAAPL